jgi:hypothetical protein
LYAFLVSPMRATCPRPSHIPDLTTLTIFYEAYKLWSSSLCSLLQLPFASKYSPQHPVFKHLQSTFFPLCDRLLIYKPIIFWYAKCRSNCDKSHLLLFHPLSYCKQYKKTATK